MKSQISYSPITSLPISAWIFVLILSIAPILVGITQTMVTDWSSERDRLLGALAPPLSPWPGAICLSMVAAIFLGTAGWFTIFVQTRIWFQIRPILIQIATLGILILVVIMILWLEITGAFVITFFGYYGGPLIGWPVTPDWIVTIGWIWTGGIILFVTVFFSMQFSRKRD